MPMGMLITLTLYAQSTCVRWNSWNDCSGMFIYLFSEK